MRRSIFGVVSTLAIVAAGGLPEADGQLIAVSRTLDYPAVRTAREERAALVAAGVVKHAPTAILAGSEFATQPILDRVEQSIRLANVDDPETLRRPVPLDEVRHLRADLARRFRVFLGTAEVQAMTDYAQALLREAPGKSLSTKIMGGLGTERAGFFGQVAEFPEARERNMVLTHNKQSRTYDLTEDRPRPRSGQMKIYGDEVRAVRELMIDLKSAPRQMRHGFATQAALDQAEAVGLLERRIYHPTGATFYAATDGSGRCSCPSKRSPRRKTQKTMRPSARLFCRSSSRERFARRQGQSLVYQVLRKLALEC